MVTARRHRPVAPDPRLYEQLRALPDHLVGEILNGRLSVSPRPASPHVGATSWLGAVVTTLFQFGGGGPGAPGGWIILDEPELHLGDDVLVPDLAGWRRTRMPEMPRVAAFALAPDWVCEGISASTEVFDRGEKLLTYAEHGVKHVWLLDADAHTLEVFRNERGVFRAVGSFKGGVKVKAEPFQAAELDLSMLWLPGPRPKSRRTKAKT